MYYDEPIFNIVDKFSNMIIDTSNTEFWVYFYVKLNFVGKWPIACKQNDKSKIPAYQIFLCPPGLCIQRKIKLKTMKKETKFIYKLSSAKQLKKIGFPKHPS